MTVELAVRPWRPETERAWVIDSWKRSFCKSTDAQEYASYESFMADYVPVIIDILDRSEVHVAHLAEEPEAAIAWACTEGGILHYVLVKGRWKRLGVARWLLGQMGLLEAATVFTHRTTICEPVTLRGATIEPSVKTPKDWQYRKFKAWRKAS